MSLIPQAATEHPPAPPRGRPRLPGCRHRAFFIASAALVLCCAPLLFDLARFAARSELYSYILLVPFISGYLAWTKRRSLSPDAISARRWAPLPLILGCAGIAGYWLAEMSGRALGPVDALALGTSSFLLLFAGMGCLFLGREILAALAFPLGFLVFMIPLPLGVQVAMETFLQHGSAAVAYAMLQLAGTPVMRQGLVFHIPGINLEVAPQCSGIHSSIALFLTSLLAGYFFLRSPWKRATLAIAVIPLALLRNGFRVFTIGELCVHVGPRMINSPIHRQGGPIFFLLSLVPFFFLLFLLSRSDRAPRRVGTENPGA
jgi:exosortase C (VPDSG-CTERM-specific)